MRRWVTLLHDFGRELGFECGSANRARNEVVWKGDAGVACSFRVTDKDIAVKASRALHGENSEIGTISFLDLEDVLWKWCQDNPDRARKLRNAVNPVNKTDEPPAPPKHVLLKVLENGELCPKHYLITLQISKGFNREPQPGQFFHVVCDPDGERTSTNGKERGYALTLRRPFSVHRVHYADFDRCLLAAPSILPYEVRGVVRRPVSKIDILYKVIGEGTRALSQVRPGRLLDVIGPIGNGFGMEGVRRGVIVGGGIGVAPLVALAERLCYLDTEVHMYLGAATQVHFRSILRDSAVERGYMDGKAFCELIINEFREIGARTVRVCTDDGSVGEKGFVTDILEADMKAGVVPNSDITIYACGPLEMMKKTSDLAHKYHVRCQVLMEERMACGIGACYSCTCNIRGKDGQVEKKRVCVDGPVFDAKEIIWQD